MSKAFSKNAKPCLVTVEDVLGVEVLAQRLPQEEAERDVAARAVVGVAYDDVLAGHERGDVGRQPLGRGEVPHGAAQPEVDGLGGRRVGHDLPVRRRRHVEGELALEVGLLERGEDAPGVRNLELRVEVDELVDRVDEAVQALAAVAVRKQSATTVSTFSACRSCRVIRLSLVRRQVQRRCR